METGEVSTESEAEDYGALLSEEGTDTWFRTIADLTAKTVSVTDRPFMKLLTWAALTKAGDDHQSGRSMLYAQLIALQVSQENATIILNNLAHYVEKIEVDGGSNSKEAVPSVALTPEERAEIEKLRMSHGTKTAKAYEEEIISRKRYDLAVKASEKEKLSTKVSIKIPQVSKLPYYVLQIFFLLAAVYDAKQIQQRIEYEEERIPTDISLYFDEKSITRIQTELARLNEELIKANDRGDSLLCEILREKIAENNRAISAASKSQKWNVGVHMTTLPKAAYMFNCSPEDVPTVRAAIRRWRLHYSETLPSGEELSKREEVIIDSKLTPGTFEGLTASIKIKAEDVIQGILKLRLVPNDILTSVAQQVNALASTAKKITNVFKIDEWPQWCQDLMTRSKNLDTAFRQISAEVKKMTAKVTMSNEEKAFWTASSHIGEEQTKQILNKLKVTSLIEIPTVWKMAIVDSQNQVDPIEFIRHCIDDEINVSRRYKVPEIKEEGLTWAAIVKKGAMKKTPTPEAGYIPESIMRMWLEYSKGSKIPDWVGKLWVKKPLITEALVRDQFIKPQMSGIEKAKDLDKVEDTSLGSFFKIMYRLDYHITDEERPFIRKALESGSLFRVAQIQKTRLTYISSHDDLVKEVSKLPARAQVGPKGKPEEGAKSKKGKSVRTPKTNDAGRNKSPANKQKSGNSTKARRGRSKTRQPSRSRSGSAKPSAKPARKSRSRSATPAAPKKGSTNAGNRKSPARPARSGSKSPKPRTNNVQPRRSRSGSKNRNQKSPKQNNAGGARTVMCGGKSRTVAELNRLVADAARANRDRVVIDNMSFTTKFLGSLLSRKDIKSIGSRYDAAGKLVRAARATK
jgi:hypothetical protein